MVPQSHEAFLSFGLVSHPLEPIQGIEIPEGVKSPGAGGIGFHFQLLWFHFGGLSLLVFGNARGANGLSEPEGQEALYGLGRGGVLSLGGFVLNGFCRMSWWQEQMVVWVTTGTTVDVPKDPFLGDLL